MVSEWIQRHDKWTGHGRKLTGVLMTEEALMLGKLVGRHWDRS